MPPRFICKDCKGEVWKQGGHKKLGLCNKCYTRYLRREPKECTICGRIMKPYRINEPICANCQSILHAKHYCEERNIKYALESHNDFEQRLKQYWWFLIDGLGEKVKSIWEAFLPIEETLTSGIIGLNWKWAELETFRKTQKVRYKAALYVYMDFLGHKGIIETRYDNRYQYLNNRLVKHVSVKYQDVFRSYLEYCHNHRKLNNWTVYLNADHLKEFFCWLRDSYNEPQLTTLTKQHVTDYLLSILERVSQKTVYNVKVVLNDFFKWAKQKRLVFTNPSAQVNVKCPVPKPKGLPLSEQKRLINRWITEDCDPLESLIGMLSLFYGVSNEELRYLKAKEINLEKCEISLETRKAALPITKEVSQVLIRYFNYRENQLKGSECEYLIISNRSARLTQPINSLTMVKKLSRANVNLRSLRATCLIDTALTGNVKVLELLGLSYEGCKPYLNLVKDSLAQKELREIKTPK